MRGRRFSFQQDIERHVANGFGSGAGVSYVPWLRVQDVPSRGRSSKIRGVNVERIYHFLFDPERAYFLVCEFSDDVVDIREQYPLFPVERAQAIATSMGVRYPTEAWRQARFQVQLRAKRTAFEADYRVQKAHACRAYAWLYRCDKQWLSQFTVNAMTHRAPRTNNVEMFSVLDSRLAGDIMQCAKALRALPGKPVRISRTRIGR